MRKLDNRECLNGFGDFIRAGRLQNKLLQREVAEQLGISAPYYCDIENGKKNVDLVVAMEICQILNIDLSDYISKYIK